MPATKIETGVYLELKRLRLTAIARKHRPDKTASMAKSLKEMGSQIQDIVVCPHDEAAGAASEFFDVLAGVGRKEAEESLGWEKGRCTIMYGLTPYEKLKVTLDENEERQPTGPLDDARIYQGMLDADKELTQEVLAKRLRMDQSTLNQYLSLPKKLSAEVQEIIDRSINLGLRHLLQICRLKTPADQLELAKKADAEGGTVGKLKAEVNQRLKQIPSSSPLPSGRGPTAVGLPPMGEGGRSLDEGIPPDPYADLWSGVRDRIGDSCKEAWQIGYVPFKDLQGEELTWMFALKNRNKVSSQRISAWLKQLAKGIDDAHLPDPDVERQKAEQAQEAEETKQIERMQKLQAKAAEAVKHAQALDQQYKAINQKAAALWRPKTAQEAKHMEASPMIPRLPNQPGEWAEVEALAPSGPGAVYEWMLGPGSYWTKKAANLTWQDLDYPDPLTGCHKLIETLRQSVLSSPAASGGGSMVSQTSGGDDVQDPIDPKIAAMIARRKAKRMLP